MPHAKRKVIVDPTGTHAKCVHNLRHAGNTPSQREFWSSIMYISDSLYHMHSHTRYSAYFRHSIFGMFLTLYHVYDATSGTLVIQFLNENSDTLWCIFPTLYIICTLTLNILYISDTLSCIWQNLRHAGNVPSEPDLWRCKMCSPDALHQIWGGYD